MYKKLSEIAVIIPGYSFRKSVSEDSKGDILLMQARNVPNDLDISDAANLTLVSSEGIRDPYFLNYNDILLVSKGVGAGSFRSTVYASNEGKVMASSSVHVIRVCDIGVIPKYLSLYLSSTFGQQELLQISTGASIQSLLVKNLLELKIPIPPIHTQKSIISLHENIIDQERIFKRKQEIQKDIINATFTNLTP